MKYDIERMNAAVQEAIEYGKQFANTDDGGTCNFDACILYVPGMRKTDAEKIENTSLFTSGFHGRSLHIHGTLGQGNRRTTMAEAQRDYLTKNYPEIKIGMYYQMD